MSETSVVSDIKLSIIIVSYERFDVLKNCLDSIKKFNDIGSALEVIVSDNSPTEDLVNNIKAEYDWVKTVKNENIGFGAGNNRGYEISRGEYLFFLNPDTILIEPIFSFAIQKFEEDFNLGLCGFALVTRDLKPNDSFVVLDKYGLFASISHVVRNKLKLFNHKKNVIHGADTFIRRSTFEEAGRFDENLFMYMEEEDLHHRINRSEAAKGVKFFKNKKIIHLEGGTQDRSEDSLIKAFDRKIASIEYYCAKYQFDFKKVVKKLSRYYKFKSFCLKVLLKGERSRFEHKKVEVLERYS